MKAFELVSEIEKQVRKNGRAGRPIVIIVDGTDGLSVKDVRWNGETEWFEIHA